MSCAISESGIVQEFGWKSEDVLRHILTVCQENMSDHVDKLREKWNALTKEKNVTITKARQANMSLAEAIQMKSKKRILPAFVNAFLYIPGMLTTIQHPSNALGCCMQQLGKDFEADSDWRELKKLKGVKDQFAKKRMTKADPPVLAWIQRNADNANDMEQATYIPSLSVTTNENEAPSMIQWMTTNNELALLPSETINMLINNPLGVSQIVEQYTKRFLLTLNKRNTFMDGFVNAQTSVTTLQRMLDTIAANLRLQRSLYQGATEVSYLDTSISMIVSFKNHVVDTLPHGKSSADQGLTLSLYKFIVARSMCLPADPMDGSASTRLSLSGRVQGDFMTNVLSVCFDKLASIVQSNQMPTEAQQHSFISKMREVQKLETLKLLNSHNDEDRQILIDAKNLGLVNLSTLAKAQEQVENEQLADEAEEEPDMTPYRGEDDDYDGI